MNWKIIGRISVSVLLLLILFFYLDFSELIKSLKQITPFLIIVAIGYVLFTIFVSTICFKVLLDTKKKLSLRLLFEYNLYSWAASQFFLGKLGTFSLIYFLNKHDISWKESSVFIAVNQLITALMLVPFAIIGVFIFFPEHFPLIIGSGMAICILAYVCKKTSLIKKLIHLLNKKFKLVLETFQLLRKKKASIVLNLVITFVGFIISACVLYFFFWKFASPISVHKILITSALVTFIGYIPISLAGLGIHEATGVYFFSLFGIAGAVTLSIYLLFRVCKYALAAIILLYFSIFYK